MLARLRACFRPETHHAASVLAFKTTSSSVSEDLKPTAPSVLCPETDFMFNE